jgi:glycerol-3-phosphate acyltransferase PlsY
VFFRFQGGKGVATAAGVLMGVQPWLGTATLLTWLLVAFVSRYSSLAALAASVLAPAYYLLGDRELWYANQGIAVAVTAMSALLLYRHRENIARLLAGTESKIGGSKKKD